jgi:hypothetical protein
MERWFDLHLYLANWGARRLMMRLPKRMVDRRRLAAFLEEADCVDLRVAGDNLIVDITRDEVGPGDWDDGSGWLAALAPLRANVLGGDPRLFYLLWLTAVEADALLPDAPEPLPGLGPMTGALKAFAEFFGIDGDLVAAAAEQPAEPVMEGAGSAGAVRRVIAGMSDRDKNGLIGRVFDGDTHVASELRALVRSRLMSGGDAPGLAARTVGELRVRADAIRLERERAKAGKAAAEQKRREEEAERARRARLVATARRGESVWREIEGEIERRSTGGYDKAAELLADLRVIAEERGETEVFVHRIGTIRERHARKEKFIQRLAAVG